MQHQSNAANMIVCIAAELKTNYPNSPVANQWSERWVSIFWALNRSARQARKREDIEADGERSEDLNKTSGSSSV